MKRTIIYYVSIALIFFVVLGARKCTVQSDAYKTDILGGSADYVAIRHLNRNHQLRDVDFDKPEGIPGAIAIYLPAPKSLIGLYLSEEVDKGKPITKEKLLPQPQLSPQAGQEIAGQEIRAVPLAEQLHTLHWLDAGINVRVSMASGVAQASVVAVTCPSLEGGKVLDAKTCAALIMLPQQKEADSAMWRLEPQVAASHKQ